MRSRVACFVLWTVCALGPVSASAQPAVGRRSVEPRVQALAARLALSPQQTGEVRVILLDAQAELVAMRDDIRTPGPERQAARQRILWHAEDRIWALLTCPQKDAYRLMERERRAAQLEALDEAQREPPPPPPRPRPRPGRPRRRGW
jgi:hypothetical protein